MSAINTSRLASLFPAGTPLPSKKASASLTTSGQRKERAKTSQVATEEKLSPLQLRAIECLAAREPEETISDVAKCAGVSRETIHRYMRDPLFMEKYKERVRVEISSNRGRMATALVRAGLTPGPGQAAMQKIYWTMLGELSDVSKVELTGKDGGAVEIDINAKPINVDSLPVWARKLILVVVSGGQISPELESKLKAEMDGLDLSMLDIGNGVDANANKPIDVESKVVREIGAGVLSAKADTK